MPLTRIGILENLSLRYITLGFMEYSNANTSLITDSINNSYPDDPSFQTTLQKVLNGSVFERYAASPLNRSSFENTIMFAVAYASSPSMKPFDFYILNHLHNVDACIYGRIL